LYASIESNQLPPKNGPVKTLPDVNLGELRDAIAVVGMSCRFPGANNLDEYWKLLVEGTDPIRHFPSERPNNHGDNIDKNFKAGFLKCPVDEFDAKFFGISPREAPFVDPQQRVLLEVIWESLENANINPQSLKESNTGVFMGIWQQDYDRFLPNTGLSANDFHHRYLGNAFSATASRISYFLGLFGPNYSIE
jgi:acyl transferase domain-containing protein